MKKQYLIIILIILACSVINKPVFSQTAIDEEIIICAVNDFLKCRLSRNSDAFLINSIERNEYENYHISNALITINIFPSSSRHHITLVDTIGCTTLPTRYIIKEGKLFYWHDPEYGLTEEMVNTLWEFNMADSIKITDRTLLFGVDDYNVQDIFGTNYIGPVITPGNHNVNERTKGADYYFCRNDLRRYKRIVTNIATGWYKPPKIKCR